MQVQLVMFKSDGSRRDFPLTRNRIIIGRTNEVGLRIPLSSVSRKHCEIAVEGDVVRLRDLGSSNGTLHNNVRVKEAELSAGDRVEVGPVVFIVQINGEPAEVEQVCSLVEQDLVDTSVGLPAVDAGQADGDAGGQVMEPGPVAPPTAKRAAAPVPAPEPAEEDVVIGEIEEPVLEPAPVKPAAVKPTPKPSASKPVAPKPAVPAAAPEVPAFEGDPEDALAAAARAAEVAGPAASFSEGATEVDLEDPIAALERLAAAERAQEDAFSMLTKEPGKDSKPKKK